MQQEASLSAFIDDPDFTLHHGDVLEVLRALPDELVHMVVTSPPYWGLRDYDIEPSVWGGNPNCSHEWLTETVRQEMRVGLGLADSPASTRGGAKKIAAVPNVEVQRSTCVWCGAWQGCLGLEPTIDLFVEHLVSIFREVRRVLRKDGTCWLNLGDSYASGDAGKSKWTHAPGAAAHVEGRDRKKVASGLKAKNLCMMPAKVAIALQDDGWFVRSQIIWAKPNPMPESATDRPTSSYELLYLLTREPRYFFDDFAVREPAEWARWGDQTVPKHEGTKTKTGWMQAKTKAELQEASGGSRNVRDVWTIATKSYQEAHFATWPTELVRRCVEAGTSAHGCCPDCAAPFEREVARVDQGWDGSKYGERAVEATGGLISGGTAHSTLGSANGKLTGQYETTGWRPTCTCWGHVEKWTDEDGFEETRYVYERQPSHVDPCIVMDPFMGTGTTAEAARKLGRHALGIEKSLDYCNLAAKRTQQQSLLAEGVENDRG